MRGWIWPPAARGRFGWCCRRFATDSAADKFGQITCFLFFWPPSLLANCFNMQTVLLFFFTSTPPVSVCNTCWFVPVLFFSGSGAYVANLALWGFVFVSKWHYWPDLKPVKHSSTYTWIKLHRAINDMHQTCCAMTSQWKVMTQRLLVLFYSSFSFWQVMLIFVTLVGPWPITT